VLVISQLWYSPNWLSWLNVILLIVIYSPIVGCTVIMHSEPSQVIFCSKSFDTFHHWPRTAAADCTDVGSRCSDCVETDWPVNASCGIDQTLAQDWISVWFWLSVLITLPLVHRLWLMFLSALPSSFSLPLRHYSWQKKNSWCYMFCIVLRLTSVHTVILCLMYILLYISRAWYYGIGFVDSKNKARTWYCWCFQMLCNHPFPELLQVGPGSTKKELLRITGVGFYQAPVSFLPLIALTLTPVVVLVLQIISCFYIIHIVYWVTWYLVVLLGPQWDLACKKRKWSGTSASRNENCQMDVWH